MHVSDFSGIKDSSGHSQLENGYDLAQVSKSSFLCSSNILNYMAFNLCGTIISTFLSSLVAYHVCH